jgi:hypothetical protein
VPPLDVKPTGHVAPIFGMARHRVSRFGMQWPDGDRPE